MELVLDIICTVAAIIVIGLVLLGVFFYHVIGILVVLGVVGVVGGLLFVVWMVEALSGR